MENKQLLLKRHLINILLKAGINISPQSLDIILNLESPLNSTQKIIKELNYLPNFDGLLTLEVLNKLSSIEILKTLKRDVLNPFEMERPSLTTSDIPITEKKTKKTQIINSPVSNLNKPPDTKIIPKPEPIKIQGTKTITKSNLNKSLNDSAKTNLHFKPRAKDFDFNFTVLKDPTSKLYTNGAYEDFYELTLDKFNSLRDLMRKRPEVLSAMEIKRINRLTSNAGVSTMGLVKNIRRTKNDNFFLVLEDLTGELNILINKNIENKKDLQTIERTIYDQMIYIEGNYNPSDQGKKGIVFVDNFTKIDIPTNFQPRLSEDPLSIALISDTHIGSKEFEESLFKRFIDFLNGKIGNKKIRAIAEKVKYLIINGDLVDGIGVYPNQFEDLVISDIYQQYNKAYQLLSNIPEYIKVFYVSGNHEPVRNAIPRPAVPKKYCQDLVEIGVKCLGNPSLLETHGVNTLIYHGESMHDLNMLIPDLDINKPVDTMRELLISRHLAPVFGKKTQIAPVSNDWLVIDKIPDVLHTGHIHINGYGKYRNVSLVNSGCFQAQTDFMKSFGIIPTIGNVPVIELDSLKPQILDFKKKL